MCNRWPLDVRGPKAAVMARDNARTVTLAGQTAAGKNVDRCWG